MITDADIRNYFASHKDDDAAKLQGAMAAYGVNKDRIARLNDPAMLAAVTGPGGAGFDENGNALLMDKPQGYSGWDGPYMSQGDYQKALDDYNAQQSTMKGALPSVISKEQFMASIRPEMLDTQGRFKGPQAGVNYGLEGLTPDEAYAGLSGTGGYTHDVDGGPTQGSLEDYRNQASAINGANSNLNTAWRPGPDNGGGFIGGLGRFASGVMSIPPISMALTAGMAPMLGEAIGNTTGWTAGTSNAVANGIIKGAQTMGSGGDIGDAIKSGALSYAGGQVGSTVGDAVGQAADSQTLGNIAGGLAKTAVTGGDLSGSLMGGVANVGLGALTSNIPGFNDLDDAQKSILTKALNIAISGKRISPKALIGLMPKKA